MKKIKLTLFIVLSLFFIGIISISAQSTVSGVISSVDGEGLIGANVVIEGTTDGTITDIDGSYTISTNQNPPFNVVVSYTGFTSQVVPVTSNNQSISVSLNEGVLFGEEVVVSASRRREKIQEAPASVSVLTARKLEVSPNDNAARAIINEPGVYIQQQGAGRVNIQLRGDGGIFGSASFPILDYRSLSGPGLGTFDNLNSPLNNIDIERIEVVRGPGSALYGPGVTSGVVHFLSKSAIDQPGTSVELIGGQQSTYGGSIRHATKVSDKFGFKINGVLKRGGEFTYDPDNPVDAGFIALTTGTLTTGIVSPAITGGIVDATQPSQQIITPADVDPDGDGIPIQDFWKSFVLNGTLEFRPQDDLSVIVAGGTNSGSAPFFNSQGVGLSQATEYWTQARIQKGGLFAQAFWLTNDGGGDTPTFLYQTGASTKIDRTQLEAQLQYNFDTPSLLNANWTTGFDYRSSQANTFNLVYGRNEDDDDFGIVGGYLQGKFALGSKLDLVLAGRADRFNFLDETAFSPRAVFVFKPSPKHTFRAGFNRAVGAPTQLQVNIDFPVSTIVPGAFDIWLLGNKEAQTFSDNPEIVFNGAVPFPSLPVGTPGIPLAFVQGAVTPAVLPALAEGLGAANPLFAPLVPVISEFLSNPANFASGTAGQFVGINLFNGQPLGLIDAPQAKLRIEDTWEVGYKGLIADKLGVSLDVYNRSIDGATLFTGISPGYSLQATDNLASDLGNSVGASVVPLLSESLAPFVGTEAIPDQATLEAIVGQVSGIIGGGYAAGGAGFLQSIAPLNDGFVLATTPTQGLPTNGVTHLAAGYRTFEKFSYTGADLGLNYFISNDLSLFGNYSWTSDNIFNPSIVGTEGTEQTSIAQPTNRYRLGVNYTPSCGMNGSLSFQHDDSFEAFLGQYSGDTDEKNLVDASVGYKFNSGTFLGLSAQNLFDTEYRTYPGFPQIGRRVLATLRHTFGAGADANPCASGGGSSKRTKSSSAKDNANSGLLSTVNPKKIDSDGDGVKDHKDLCPDIPGTKKFKGCPKDKAIMDAEAEAARVAAVAEAERVAAEEARAEAARKKAAAEAKAKADAAAAKKAAEEAKMKAEADAKAAAEAAEKAKVEAAAKAAAARKAEIASKTNAVFARALTGIKFNSSRSTFKNESYTLMDDVAAIMNEYPGIEVRIAGHTDSQGNDESNQRLSEKRAVAVMNYLVSKGISPTRLRSVGFGEAAPVADNNTAAGRAENRRVEFSVINN